MFVTRFAPSPTGLLHAGHAVSALTAFEAAQAAGGRFLLRIEDTDQTRCRPDYDAALLEDLRWLGLDWEEPVRRQSQHMGEYAACLDRLRDRGLLYRCFRTRREIMAAIADAPHGPGDAVTPGPHPADEEARRLEAGDAFAWRLSMARARDALGPRWRDLGFEADGAWTPADPARAGDLILARKEFPASYHLACVHDDALQGVTHVIRGEDLREAAHVQVLLQALMGLPTPVYRHHPLVLDGDGRRLAKRDGAPALRDLRARGVRPGDIRSGVIA